MEGLRENREVRVYEHCPTFAKKRCIVRKAKFKELEKPCYTWFMQQRSKGAPVSGPLLKEKAFLPFIQKVVVSHLCLALDDFQISFLDMESEAFLFKGNHCLQTLLQLIRFRASCIKCPA